MQRLAKERMEITWEDWDWGQVMKKGDRLLQFCQKQNLIITNTFFKLPFRRLYKYMMFTRGQIVKKLLEIRSTIL